jgi:dymeclin
MGINVNVSKPVDLNSNQYLQQFVGKVNISADNKDFYEEFLKFSISTPLNEVDTLNLDSRLESFLESFIQSNLQSGNLGSLITVFLNKSADLLALSDSER